MSLLDFLIQFLESLPAIGKILALFSNRSNKKSKTPLTNHPLFSSINFWVNMTCPNIPVESKLKKAMICKFLTINLNAYAHKMHDFLEECDFEKDEVDFGKLSNLIMECVEEYEYEALKNGIPDMFLQKFREWNQPHMDMAFNGIKSICESGFYESNYDKCVAVLDLLQATFHLTLLDAEKTINGMNGHLEAELERLKNLE